ncbi:uncharacterized protein J4E92_003160 [Alternaria infectoria]|uniref:uncharacterized protein n=1 Tax=Alternaria infectoria TaxID=45303 RepID=UPI002220E8B7|nr:uncharacterized protein J4E92_003160 [Alternaria infectoria]KAI4933493.1 hypothetical protein J4E92_003160 [Alternaria infectoria]
MDSLLEPEHELPTPLTYLHTLLTAAEDTHEARSKVVAAYDTMLLYALAYPRKRALALNLWTANLGTLASTPSGDFGQAWQELMERREELIDYMDREQMGREQNAVFMDVRVDDYTQLWLRMLQLGYDGQYAAFLTQLIEEQPRYFDRPSDIDNFVQQRSHPEDFPYLGDLLLIPAPATGHGKTAESVLNLLVHHIAYICDLFQRTDYAPSPDLVEAFAEYRIDQLSRMFGDPGNYMPLDARIHCANVNHRTIHDFVILRAKEILQSAEKELLNWHMYKWLVQCVESVFKDVPRTTILFDDLSLGVGSVEQRNYIPFQTANLRVPDRIIQAWQEEEPAEFEPASFEDVKWEAAGPRIQVRSVASPVQLGPEAICPVDLEPFDVRSAATVAWEVECGHAFHAQCLEDLVNGIEKNSNRCPLCRAEICDARERRRIE